MTPEEAIKEAARSGKPLTLPWSETLSDSLVCDWWTAYGYHDSHFRGRHDGRPWEIRLVPNER